MVLKTKKKCDAVGGANRKYQKCVLLHCQRS